MKRRSKVTILAIVLFVIGAIVLLPGGASRRATEQTRGELRQQGFKVDPAEFNISTAPEVRRRMAALTNLALFTLLPLESDRRQPVYPAPDAAFMSALSSDSAVAYWKITNVPGASEDIWQRFREALDEHSDSLDAACAATASGPIQFDFTATDVETAVLRHLSVLRWLGMILPSRAVLELRDGNSSKAWTNLLAATRLATAWRAEPAEMSHLTRRACAIAAFDATWQLLQTNAWTEEQLHRLQEEWENLNYLKDLSETVAFARANMITEFQTFRQTPIRFGFSVGGVFRAPGAAWRALIDCWRRVRYRQDGSYEDERRFLLYSCARERELREAVESSDWLHMRSLPGITNFVAFTVSNSRLSARTQQSIAKLGLRIQSESQSLTARAADAEARRRVLITAIALERYRIKHGAYPESLAALTPTFLKDEPIDFVDGKPLRYRRTADGYFVLWSIGLDAVDDGGALPRKSTRAESARNDSFLQSLPTPTEHSDIVWPRPATTGEVQAARSASLQVVP